jgi:hypothetical protein
VVSLQPIVGKLLRPRSNRELLLKQKLIPGKNGISFSGYSCPQNQLKHASNANSKKRKTIFQIRYLKSKSLLFNRKRKVRHGQIWWLPGVWSTSQDHSLQMTEDWIWDDLKDPIQSVTRKVKPNASCKPIPTYYSREEQWHEGFQQTRWNPERMCHSRPQRGNILN